MFSARSSVSMSPLEPRLSYKYDAFEKREGKIRTILSLENIAKENAVNHDNKIKIQPLKALGLGHLVTSLWTVC